MKYALELLFIIGAPVMAFTAITLVSAPREVSGGFIFDPMTPDWFITFSALVTHAHVVMVFTRSHLNKNIYRRFPLRFSLVPLIALAAFSVWPKTTIVMSVVALYWDEWHSIMQIFGFGRMYDVRLGNDPMKGRRLDMGFCFVIALLPHVLLLTYLPENVRLEGLNDTLALSGELALKYGHFIHSLRYPIIAIGISYTIFYFWSYAKLIKEGYKVSGSKICLLATTGITLGFTVYYYSILDAANYSNIHHALQYFFIVSLSESTRFAEKVPGQSRINKKLLITACSFLTLSVAFIAAAARLTNYFPFLGNFWLLSSLLHFWYDGFIWSVRKQDI